MIGTWLGVGGLSTFVQLRVEADLRAWGIVGREVTGGFIIETYLLGHLDIERGRFRSADSSSEVSVKGTAITTGVSSYAHDVVFSGIRDLVPNAVLFRRDGVSWFDWLGARADWVERPFLRNGFEHPVKICILAGRAEELCLGPGAPGRTLFHSGYPLGGVTIHDEEDRLILRTDEEELRLLGCLTPGPTRPEVFCELGPDGVIAVRFPERFEERPGASPE